MAKGSGLEVEEHPDEAVANQIEQAARDDWVLIEKRFEFRAVDDANARRFGSLG